MKKRTIFFVLIAAHLLISCQQSNDNSSVLDLTCDGICWNNIKFGEFSIQETIDTLSSDPIIAIESIEYVDFYEQPFDGRLRFEFANNNLVGDIFFLEDRVTFVEIKNLEDAVSVGELGITVGEMIDRFGQPSFLLRSQGFAPAAPLPDTLHTFVHLISPEGGFAFDYDEDILPRKSRGLVSEEIELYTLVLFYPDDFDYLMENYFLSTVLSQEDLVNAESWNGYGEYPRK